MVKKVSLSDEFLEHCLTSTPTLEGVKAFLASNEYYTYWRYWMKDEEERENEERRQKRLQQADKKYKTEVATRLLLDTEYAYPVQTIAKVIGTDIEFVENIKSKLKL